jgi:transcriptional regulator with XRE-family HTH domain
MPRAVASKNGALTGIFASVQQRRALATLPSSYRHVHASLREWVPCKNRGIPIQKHPKTVGELLRLRRMQLKLKQGEAARLLGVSMVSLSKWERNLILSNSRYDKVLKDLLVRDAENSQRHDCSSNEAPFIAYSSVRVRPPVHNSTRFFATGENDHRHQAKKRWRGAVRIRHSCTDPADNSPAPPNALRDLIPFFHIRVHAGLASENGHTSWCFMIGAQLTTDEANRRLGSL